MKIKIKYKGMQKKDDFIKTTPKKSNKLLKIMKIYLLITFSCVFSVIAENSYSQSESVTLKIMDVTLKEALKQIEESTDYLFLVMDDSGKDLEKKINISLENNSIDEILTQLLKDTNLSYSIVKRQITIQKNLNVTASTAKLEVTQQPSKKSITGKIVGADGEAIIGATIVEKKTTNGTVTNVSGEYLLQVSEGAILIFSFVGYIPEEIEVGSENVINVVLAEDIAQLGEVVVVGYGVQKKINLTGALTTIKTKELVQSPQANISNSLVGRMSGLMSVQRSGQPGEDQADLRIRGVGTFTGSQGPLVMVDGIEGVNYNSIDPNEIESLTILKDASSTAVYGVRGANGVILITTKRGSIGKPQVSFTSNFALSQFTDMRESVSAYDYTRGFNEALKYDSYITGGYTEKYTQEEIDKYRSGEDPLFYPNIDWFKLMYAPTSLQTQHNLSFNGGVKGVKYFVSAGYFNQEGLFSDEVIRGVKDYNAQPRFKRYNFRSNLDFDIAKGLTAKVNISSQTEIRQGNTSTINRTIELAVKANPVSTPGLWDGMLIYLPDAPILTSPVDQLLRSGYSRGYKNHLNGSVQLNYELDFITKGLSTHGTVSYINMNSQDGHFPNVKLSHMPRRLPDGSIVFIPQGEESPFYYNETVDKYRREYFEFGFDYSRSFGNHNVGGLVLYNQSKLYNPELAFLIPQGYQGYVGRATYNFADRYLVEFNIGYNGTENFAEGKRFGVFPAYSLGWVASEEPFFPKNDFVSFLKIRGSFGEVGNDQIGGDRFLYMPSSYGYENNYNFGTVGTDFSAYRVSNEGKIGNPDLTWERAKKMNIGTDMVIWKDKLKITADIFQEKRDNILASLGTVSTIVGANLPAFNLGKMKNSGFDGEISFNDHIKAFRYWIKGNYTYAHNVVEFQDEAPKTYSYQNSTGQRFGQYFGLVADGFYNTWEEVNNPNRPRSSYNNNKIQPGDLKYIDINGDGIIDPDDEIPIGYSNFPEKIFGLSFGGNFKGIDLSCLFQGAGNVSVSYSRHARYGYRENADVPDYILDKSWTQERYEQGLPIEFPHLSEGDVNQKHNYVPSTFWVRDASYVRLKNVEIGYTFTRAFLTKIGIKSARIFTNGNNLITWSDMLPGIDPESSTSKSNWEPYPLTRTFNLGFNVKF